MAEKTKENEYWYVGKLKEQFGDSINDEKILNTYDGYNYIHLCNMLTIKELEIEWIDEFSTDCELKYETYPVWLGGVIMDLKASSVNAAELVASNGRIARITKTKAYVEYLDLWKNKISSLREMYDVEGVNVEENKFYKLELIHYEVHPKDNNDFKIYYNNQGELAIGYLLNYTTKKNQKTSKERLALIDEKINQLKENANDIVGVGLRVISDLTGADQIGNKVFCNPQYEKGLIIYNFEVIPEKNELAQAIVKYKEYWPQLMCEIFGSEKFRLLKMLSPVVGFELIGEVKTGPYEFDKRSSLQLQSEIYKKIPRFEDLYDLLIAYDKSRIIDGSNEQFKEQLIKLLKILDKLELYDVQKEYRAGKKKENLRWVEIDKMLLENVQKTMAKAWFDQEALVNEMYCQAKEIVPTEQVGNLNAMFYALHLRTMEEGEILSEYVNHELVCNTVFRKGKKK